MSRKKSRRRRSKLGMKGTVKMALSWEAEVRDLAVDHGLSVRISAVRCSGGKVETHHWMFDDENGRVLDYWPGTGRWYSCVTKERGTVKDVWEALDVAAKVSSLAYRDG